MKACPLKSTLSTNLKKKKENSVLYRVLYLLKRKILPRKSQQI